MRVTVMHPEQVRMHLRMKHKTLVRFAEANGVSVQAVRDYLRLQSNTVHALVARELGFEPTQLQLSSTNVEANSKAEPLSHRQNAGAR